MKINTTTGKFAIEVEGKVATQHFEALVQEGLTSMLFRKAFPKTELAMAKAVKQTELTKGGELRKSKEFERGKVPFSVGLAGELATILQEFCKAWADPDGELKVKVTEYVPDNGNAQKKAFDAAMAAVDGMKEFLPEEVYATQVAKLKAQYGQE